ncbi:MAG: ribonuclease H-like domain-containing protein [Candidatus Aminicenantes bacterium]|nr:MAG: ribonuclease H-like domain-containing protein [Candidatus Aminicenantes bacterium]
MTDIKDKLERIKKERQTRSKSQQVTSTWRKIQEEEDLSTKEKLERLINLTRQEKLEEAKSPTFEPLPREPLQWLENSFALDVNYGRIKIASGLEINGEVLACLSQDDAFKELDLSTALFIDLETTGLSGGTGIIPFNIGMGYYRDDKFLVGQYFLGEMAEEERMIQELGAFFKEMNFQSVVTYNGKSFDIPLLETRFILHRQPFQLNGLPHLDFLYPARRLWSHKYESCRLFHLALNVVQAGRTEDIPSAEIPWRYFQYLQTGNYDLIEPILYHNQEDILSLLGVVVIGAHIFSEDPDLCLGDAMDFYGAGKVMANAGDVEKSAQFFQKALDGNLTDEVSVETKKRLSAYFKKRQDWDKAVPIWKEMTSTEVVIPAQLFSFRELAMHFEHRLKNYEEAKRIAEEGFVLSTGVSSYYEKDFSYRLDRLRRKIKQKKDKS